MRRGIILVAAGVTLAAVTAAQQEPAVQPERAAQPEAQPERELDAELLRQASPVERAILERLERIERGLFRPGSTLPRSDDDSLEQRVEALEALARGGRAPGIIDDATRLHSLDRELKELDDRVQRGVERPIEELARRIDDIERLLDRLERGTDVARELGDLRRSLDRVERQLASIERRIG